MTGVDGDAALAPLLLEDGGVRAAAWELLLYGEEVHALPILLHASDFRAAMQANVPAVLQMSHSEALAQHCAGWTVAGAPCWPAIVSAFGADTGVVATDCDTDERVSLSLADFVATWSSTRLLYLKDLHLVAAQPGFCYTEPSFAPDWLGRCFDRGMDGAVDLRFLYAGPAGTSTPTHIDIGHTFSWSWSLAGIKRWQMWHPEAASLLLDRWGGAFAPFPEECSGALYPRALEAMGSLCLEFNQSAGEVVFVPAGWAHNVRNVSDALSVSCNWLNEHNVGLATDAALAELQAGCACAANRLSDALCFYMDGANRNELDVILGCLRRLQVM